MFHIRFKFVYPGLLALYSFMNIRILGGDRLYQADLTYDKLFVTVVALCYAVWFSNFYIEKFAGFDPKKFHPLLIQFLGSLVAVSIISFLSVSITGLIFGEPYDLSFQNLILTSGFAFRINLFLNCVNATYFFSKKFREKAVEAEKLHTFNVSARLETLNSQINPHFFFNNLSTLSVLIHENPVKADEYLQKLSNIYRYILNNRDKELVTLKEEFVFLQNYIDLLSIRFKDSLKFNLQVDNDLSNLMLPPAVMQLLVENVVKHNYFTIKEPLEVFIKSNSKELIVKNKKQVKEAVEFSTGIGLQNISDRYRFLGNEIIILDKEKYFEIRLPLISANEDTHSRR